MKISEKQLQIMIYYLTCLSEFKEFAAPTADFKMEIKNLLTEVIDQQSTGLIDTVDFSYE